MSKSKKNSPKKSAEKKPAMRWSLGVFESAKSGDLIAVYCRVDGTVAPLYAKSVASKKAKFHAKYVGVTYAEAREQLFKDAAKAGVRQPVKKEENGNPKLKAAA